MKTNIFNNISLDDDIKILDINDNLYEVICKQLNCIANKYIITQQIHSDLWWGILENDFSIDKKNIWTNIEYSIDDKGKEHKYYKNIISLNKNDIFEYYINIEKMDKNEALKKYPINFEDGEEQDPVMYFVFIDELRNYENNEYFSDTKEEDKTNKISSLSIYYNCSVTSTKIVEDLIISKLNDKKAIHIPSTENTFYTIGVDNYGYQLQPADIRLMDIDLELNYGKDFVSIDESILDKLKNEYHGLFLLHGKPGTGKTTYIRRLISKLSKEKTIIYIPSYLMESIADPSFMTFLSTFKESILILEDSEAVVTKSNNERSQGVSNILNICDGLLGDNMKIQIISTFNIQKGEIDEALKRAGRLMVDYEFRPLKPEDANILSKHIGHNKVYDKDVSLSEIYQGHNIIENSVKKTTIGF